MNTAERIKELLNISSVVEGFVRLKKKGQNFYGLCPFHKEKTPSFSVNDEKRIYHCFGCGANGDIFDFIMEMDCISFNEALEKLGKMVGVEVKKNNHSISRLYEINKQTSLWFEQQLQNNDKVRLYLSKRNLSESDCRNFNIGYAPKNSGLKQYLIAQGFRETDLQKIGLLNKNKNEIFRERVIFPIYDDNSKIIGFGGRAIEKQNPKYINSQDSIIFKKGMNLYKSRQFKKSKKYSIVVEGYTDVISANKAGLYNTLAPLGTSITNAQLDYIFKFSKNIFFCFDGDKAGREASFRVIPKILSSLNLHNTVFFTLLPQNSDPDSIIRDSGVNRLKKLLKKSPLLSEVIYNLCTEGINLNSAEGRYKAENNFATFLKEVKNSIIYKNFKQFFSQELYKSQFKKKNTKINPQVDIKPSSTETTIIKLVLLYPEILNNPFTQEQFASLEMKKFNSIQTKILEYINMHNVPETDNLTKFVDINLAELYNSKETIPKNSKDALNIWNRMMKIIEVENLEKEYEIELTKMIMDSKENTQSSAILKLILKLKQEIQNDI